MLLWSPFVLLACAALAPLVTRLAGRSAGWVLGAIPAALFVHFLGHLPVGPGEFLRESVEWVPGLGVEVAFLLDGLSIVFALLVTGIGALVLVYAGGYMAGTEADWWIAVGTPRGTFSSDLEAWSPGLRSFQAPLEDVSPPATILLTPVLPPGEYAFLIAIDANPDGKPDLDQLITWDHVELTVK